MNDGQIPNVRAVRVALGTGYNRVERNRRASRNGRVSCSPPRNPSRYDSQLSRRCTDGLPRTCRNRAVRTDYVSPKPCVASPPTRVWGGAARQSDDAEGGGAGAAARASPSAAAAPHEVKSVLSPKRRSVDALAKSVRHTAMKKLKRNCETSLPFHDSSRSPHPLHWAAVQR
jgi:hypothetical protein